KRSTTGPQSAAPHRSTSRSDIVTNETQPGSAGFSWEESTMAKGYWIVRVDIDDLETYKSYIAANVEPLRKYEAKFIVRGGEFEAVEGTSRVRNAVIEFPSYEQALDCWHSPEYQAALRIREAVSTADLIIIRGCDEPRP